MSHILITGGAGFIGRNLISKLVKHDNSKITVFDNESTGDRHTVNHKSVTFLHGDIRNRNELRKAVQGVSTIVNLAAETRVLDSISNPELNFDVNTIGAFNLLLEAQTAGIKTFINASTGGAIIGDAVPPVHEGMPPSPLSPYGASKLANEGYLSAFAASYGMRTVSLRFSNVYGPGSLHKGSVIAHFFKMIMDGRPVEVFGDGAQSRDFLFIDDLTEGVLKTLESNSTGVFQLGSGSPTSINDLINEMRIVVGSDYPFKVRYNDARTGEIHQTWCNIDKAKQILGFRPNNTLKVGLEKTWSWLLKVKG